MRFPLETFDPDLQVGRSPGRGGGKWKLEFNYNFLFISACISSTKKIFSRARCARAHAKHIYIRARIALKKMKKKIFARAHKTDIKST